MKLVYAVSHAYYAVMVTLMWVEELTIENIRCFESMSIRFTQGMDSPHRWVTFLSENGGGKSTALQALGLLLAGPEGAQKLLPRPVGWLRNEELPGKIATRIHKDNNDPGEFGTEKIARNFGYSYNLTGTRPLTVNNKLYTEPSVVPSGQKILAWLRENAFPSGKSGWFAVGYGAFRRLTRSNQIMIPSLDPQARYLNFLTQFSEDEAISTFERWMVYLDYRIHKAKDAKAEGQQNLGIQAINRVLPAGARFHRVSVEGRIFFKIGNEEVPTIALSDGYRSVLALAGDLIWRLLLAFPDSQDALKEKGVVLIDELDIHLHPVWQRQLPEILRDVFPNLQFFVATHSPLVAAGAGEDALTFRFDFKDGRSRVEKTSTLASMNVERVLQSEAFGLVSPFSPQTQKKIDRFDSLRKKKHRNGPEESELLSLYDFMERAKPIGGPPEPGSLDEKVDEYLRKNLHDQSHSPADSADSATKGQGMALEIVVGKNGERT
jgi:hypothetical protein